MTTTATPSAATAPAASTPGVDAGLLLLRLAVGLTMAAHGVQKLFGWFGGPGLDGTEQFFSFLGYPSGRTMALIAGLSETLGGLGLALGLLSPLAAAAVVGTMLNALVSAHWDAGFFGDGIEYPMVLGVAAAALALTGPGRWSVDATLPAGPLRVHRPVVGAAAVALGLATAAVVLLLRS
jgi:putative oxidoreductase